MGCFKVLGLKTLIFCPILGFDNWNFRQILGMKTEVSPDLETL